MDEKNIVSKINAILKTKNIPIKLTANNMHSNLKDSGVNSLDLLEIIIEIEKQYDISLDDQKILEIKTPFELIELIKSSFQQDHTEK